MFWLKITMEEHREVVQWQDNWSTPSELEFESLPFYQKNLQKRGEMEKEYFWEETKNICIHGLHPEKAIEAIQKLIQDIPDGYKENCFLSKGQDYDDLNIKYKREKTIEEKRKEKKERIAFLEKQEKMIRKQLNELKNG